MSLLLFLQTGNFKGITLGMTLSTVENQLGKPVDISISKKPLIYKYDSVEFAFLRDKISGEYLLQSMHFYFNDSVIHDKYATNTESIGSHTCSVPNSAIEYFERKGVRIQLDKKHTINNLQLGFCTDAGVVIIYESIGTDLFKLNGFHHS